MSEEKNFNTNENEEQNKKSLKVLESDYNCISQTYPSTNKSCIVDIY